MAITLANEIEIEIVTGVQLQGAPELSDRELTIIPNYPGAIDEYAYGSDNITSDEEYQFSRETLILMSVRLKMPCRALDSADAFIPWLEQTPEIGLPRLCEGACWYHNGATHLWLDPHGTYLGCLYEGDSVPREAVRRLRIATDVDLLLAQQRVRGWMLRSPLDHLFSIDPSKIERDEEFVALFNRYFRLIVKPDVDLLMTKDPRLLEMLQRLSADLDRRADLSGRRDLLKAWITYFIESSY